MNQVSPFLFKRLPLSCLYLSAFSLLSCAPYEKCDELLKVGDELTFKLTEGPSEQEQIDECGAPLPFDVGSVFHLTVERFIGGDRCDSATVDVKLGNTLVFEWLVADARRSAATFTGEYRFDEEGCSYQAKVEFNHGRLKYDVWVSPDQTSCSFQRCLGSFFGEWVE